MSGYNTIHIIADAIKRAGAAEPAKIREALIATDYTGPTGRLRFYAKGQVYGQSVFLVELKGGRSEGHTSELQSLMRISYPAFFLNTQHHYKTSHCSRHAADTP